MAGKKTNIEGPAEKMQFKPGEALSMPTKKYSDVEKGKKTTIEGPCSGKKGC